MALHLDRLGVTDFRNLGRVDLTLEPGLNVVRGDNGQGKTSLLEAVGFLGRWRSFRGAAVDEVVRAGATSAVIRASGVRGARDLLLEAELHPGGRHRFLLNRQVVRRAGERAEGLLVSVFAPDDLELVKGGPAGRRLFLDDLVENLQPRLADVRGELDRVLRQRNALLKSARGRVTSDVRTTLDVWNERLVRAGEALTTARRATLDALAPLLDEVYDAVAGSASQVTAAYRSTWVDGGLAAALRELEADELRRGQTLAGPQRDDVELRVGGLLARTQASQGEQRSLALALRLAAHRLVTEVVGEPPVLLLDDLFSELDPHRSSSLLEHLPVGQVLLTTAGPLPTGAEPAVVIDVDGGRCVRRGS